MATRQNPPAAARHETVTLRHGVSFEDPYSWLQEREDPAVIRHLEAENAYTESILQRTGDLRVRLFAELKGRIQEDDDDPPFPHGPFEYWSRTKEGKQYSIHLRRPKGTAKEEVLLDENQRAEGKAYYDVGSLLPSPDHRLIAFTEDDQGDERYTLRVKDMQAGTLLPDTIKNVDDVAFAADGQTLLYTVIDEAHRPYRVFAHALGTDPSSDRLLYEERDAAFYLGVDRTRSGAWLLISAGSQDTSEVWALPADRPEGVEPRSVFGRTKGVEYGVEHHGLHFYVTTNENAQTFKLVRTLAEGGGALEEIIPYRPGVTLEQVEAFEEFLCIFERREGIVRVRVRDLARGTEHEVALPEAAYSVWPSRNREFRTQALRLGYESMVTPSSVYDYDLRARKLTRIKERPVIGYDRSAYVTERLTATSADGTKVPISVVHKRGRPRDGKGLLYVYGYGAYGSAIDPYFSSNRLSLLDRGFAFAIAHVRGGGALGRPWYEAGKLGHKERSFEDFESCTDELIHSGYGARERTVIGGGSAGGLLMGAVINRRPDLAAVCVADVPFVDVLNTMSDASLPLTVVEYDEWGNPEDPEFFEVIARYSPYENVQATCYPHLFVTAGLHDPRVGYWEPAKWVARLRHRVTCDHTIALYTQMAGHGGASGRYDALKEIALEYAFLLHVLGVAE
jgi:oligopeptidase B